VVSCLTEVKQHWSGQYLMGAHLLKSNKWCVFPVNLCWPHSVQSIRAEKKSSVTFFFKKKAPEKFSKKSTFSDYKKKGDFVLIIKKGDIALFSMVAIVFKKGDFQSGKRQ